MNCKRVSKPIARKMFNDGYKVRLLPCKVNDVCARDGVSQGHFWVSYFEVSLDTIEERDYGLYNKFDRMVNNYEYHNCNAELGYYAHYFVDENDYNKFKEEHSHGNQKIPCSVSAEENRGT